MKKKKIFFFIILIIIGCFFVILIINKKERISKLKRPEINESETIYILDVESPNGKEKIEVAVSPVKIQQTQINEYLDSAFEILIDEVRGENASLSEVRNDLNFVSGISKMGVHAEYYLDDYTVIDCYGRINNMNISPDGERHIIKIHLSYEKNEKEYEIPVNVYPPILTEKQKLQNEIEKAISECNKENIDSEYIILPDNVDGINISFFSHPESRIPLMVCILLAAGLGIYYKKVIYVRKKQEKRDDQVRMDYSEIVTKLTLLICAGMSSANAMAKIAYDYKQIQKKNPKYVRPAYEELSYTSNRISMGTSEPEAYTEFGRNCRVHSFVKLGNMLSQNIRKGAEGFTAVLKDEVSEAFTERKNLAKKAGEEAGTKLLFPMVIMLGIVLIIIVVPAFMSF